MSTVTVKAATGSTQSEAGATPPQDSALGAISELQCQVTVLQDQVAQLAARTQELLAGVDQLMRQSKRQATPSSGGTAERSQRLQHLHQALVDLVMHEGRFVSERTNIFLLLHSIFFAGFILLGTQTVETVFTLAGSVVIPIFGILFSAAQILVIASNIEAANHWRSAARRIQLDDDFWWPTKTEQDNYLAFFHSNQRAWRGESMPQAGDSITGGGFAIRKLEPNRVLGIWLPFAFGLLWLLALVCSLTPIVAAIIDLYFG